MQETATARPEDVGLCSTRIGRVDTWMRQQVSGGRLAGIEVMINRRGRTAFHRCHGKSDLSRNADATPETIYRIYSMTKPLTAVAAMMLYEEGRFQLDDPISRRLPEFAGQRVFSSGGYGAVATEPAVRDITFRDLLTHTSGLTYGFMQATPVDAIYREQKIELPGAEEPLADVVARLARVPLIAQPGAEWNYSISIDVLGHLIAVISGQPFDAFLRERIIGPLGMTDTDFFVPPGKVDRLAASYGKGADGRPRLLEAPRGQPVPEPAESAVRRRRPRRHRARLHALRPDAACAGCFRFAAAARAKDRRADDHEPPRRRHGGDGAAALC